MGLHDFKMRFSSHPNAKNSVASNENEKVHSGPEAPSPTIPMDFKRRFQVQQVPSEQQRVGNMTARGPTTYANHATQDMANSKPRGAAVSAKEFFSREPLPTSPSFYGESMSGSGEPLFQDKLPTRPVPREFKPSMRTKNPEVPSTGRHEFLRHQQSLEQMSQRPTVRMELDPEEIESIQLRRSRAKSAAVVAPWREEYVSGQCARETC